MGREPTNKSIFTEASSWEKQVGGGPISHRNINKSIRSGKWIGPFFTYDLERISSTYPEACNSQLNTLEENLSIST